MWIVVFGGAGAFRARPAEGGAELPASLRVVLEQTRPLSQPRGSRLPLWVLPISQSLAGIDDARTEQVLRDLEARGIGYTVTWNPGALEQSATEALRIARLQQRLGLMVGVDATACLGFFDGTDATLHEDEAGRPFAETSFGGKLGCPFALEARRPLVADRVKAFVRRYVEAGLRLDFVFADWEIDGPIEWNDAWASSKRCRRCRREVPGLEDFRVFQGRLRELRSALQREAFASPVKAAFPEVLVGNYGVNPHDGHRYWYDYFEHEAEGVPYRADQRARYREWAHEFAGTGYTFALPVVYTWYRNFDWYDHADPDFRWCYSLLLEGSSVGRTTPRNVPLIPFVHWTTTAPPDRPDPRVRQFSAAGYRELLWHLLLRGHDTFFLWCMPDELATEIRLLHAVYAESLAYRDFLDRGEPVSFDVPSAAAPVVSGLRLGDRVLVRRTEFGDRHEPLGLAVPGGGRIQVPAHEGLQVLPVRPASGEAGFLREGAMLRFPIGFYELPASDAALRAMADAGVNLVRCSTRGDLDRAAAVGMQGWVPLPVQSGATPDLERRVREVADHPALAVWEGPDEVVWNFTAYSGLKRTAGFSREDWRWQRTQAVAYAAAEGARTLAGLRDGISLVRRLDPRCRPFWINEAADSDLAYVRGYVESIDITGCDYYPVRSTGSDLPGIGRAVDRWRAVGGERPVWMVLQAFSWHGLRPDRGPRYPTFGESRFMAYDAIVHGARGLLYWGSDRVDDPAFRTSLYAVTAEIAALGPWLSGELMGGVQIRLVADVTDAPGLGVRGTLRRRGNDFVLVLVNEDPEPHLGVEVAGLGALEGRELRLLEGGERVSVERGGLVTRLPGFAVKVFGTGPTPVIARPEGRDYGEVPGTP